MSDTPDLLAAARLLAERIDRIQADAAALVGLVEASIPKTPDGVPIPEIMLEAARKAVSQMVAAGLAPSKTAVIQQLRLWRFSIGKDMERPIWEHVAPLVEVQPETAEVPAVVAELPVSSVLLDGDEWREAG